MPIELFLPKYKVPAPEPPSYLALAEAFGVGAGTHLFDKSRYRSHSTFVIPTWAAGLHGWCLDFNPAIPNWVTTLAAFTQLNFTSEDFSLVMRINPDNVAAGRTLIQRGLRNTDGYDFYISSGGGLNFVTNQALAAQFSRAPAGTIIAGNWYTVGVSRTGASVLIYANGVDVTNVWGVHLDPLTSARNFYIGIQNDLMTSPFDGRVEFLRVFRGIALATSEHLAWHNALA